jgi:hypothetical protein
MNLIRANIINDEKGSQAAVSKERQDVVSSSEPGDRSEE